MKRLLLLLTILPLFCHGQIITTIAGNGTAGYSGDGNYATIAKLDNPYCICFDRLGNMYIADAFNNVIRKINTSGIITTIAGTGYGAGTSSGTGGYSGDGGQATNAQLWEPCSVTCDTIGNIYFSDRGNFVIRKVDINGIIHTIAGNGLVGFSGDNGPATNANLYHPLGIAIDKSGNVYFSDAGNKRVRKINNAGTITTFAGGGTAGLGDGGPATAAQLDVPGFIAFNSAGELFIPDWQAHRVRKVAASGVITTIAGNGSGSDGGDGLQATAASIRSPYTIAFDDSGNYYVSNYVTCVIRKINSTGIITTIAGNGISGYSGDNGPATAAEINPTANATAVDIYGNLYIADSKNYRIRRVAFNSTSLNDPTKPKVNNILIYPNPAENKITVKAAESSERIEIYSTIGQQVFSGLYQDMEAQIDVSYLPQGIYFVKMGVVTMKLVKE